MPNEDGGLSKAEFLLIQEQLLQFRNRIYDLQDQLNKKNFEIQQLQISPKNEALQFASKLMNRASSRKEDSAKDQEIDSLRLKLATQEEDFRLQQSTLFQEMNSLSAVNEQLKKQIQSYDVHPLEKEQGALQDKNYEKKQMEAEIAALKSEKEQISAELLEAKSAAKKNENLLNVLESTLLEYRDKITKREQDLEMVQNILVHEREQSEKDRKKLEDAEIHKSNEFKKLHEAHQNIQELQFRLEMMQQQEYESKASFCEEIQKYQEKLQTCQGHIEKYKIERQNEVAESEERIHQLVMQLEEAEKQIEEEKRALELKIEQVDEYKAMLESKTDECNGLEGEYSELEDNLKSVIDQFKKSSSEAERRYRKEILDLQKKMDELKTELVEKETAIVGEQFRAEYLERTINTLKNDSAAEDQRKKKERLEMEKKQQELIAKLEKQMKESSAQSIEEQATMYGVRCKLEVEDLTKSFEAEKEQLNLKITSLEEKIKLQEEEKKLALKKQAAMMKELQKSLKEERKRADSFERKIEEKSGWHVVQDCDHNSSHTYDGNESVSSQSAIESENVELITRLATLQKLHSENTDTILQLESENSRLRREVLEKGELIEHWIKERPMKNGFNSQQQNLAASSSPKTATNEVGAGFRRLLNTLGQDQSSNDLKEMNKKLQRMLEETLSRNILLQRDLQTLLERTEL